MLDPARRWKPADDLVPRREARPASVPRSALADAQLQASRNSRTIRRLRLWLPLAALALALGFIGWTMWSSRSLSGVGIGKVLFSKDGLTMVEPHISGKSQGQSYDVTAARGIQSFQDAKKVRFEDIVGRIELRDRSWANVRAPVGLYEGQRQFLRLEGGVDVTSSNGYTLKVEAVDIDLESGRMTTDHPVDMKLGAAAIRAGTMRVDDGGKSVSFSGGVSIVAQPDFSAPASGGE